MCLMGDIQSGLYYLPPGDVHLSKYSVRIVMHALYETLDRHYNKIFTFPGDKKLAKLRSISLDSIFWTISDPKMWIKNFDLNEGLI